MDVPVRLRRKLIARGCATRHWHEKASFDVCERGIGILRADAAVKAVAAKAQPQIRRRQCWAVGQNRSVLRFAKGLLQLAPQLPLEESAVQGTLGILAKLLVFVVSVADQVTDGREVVHGGSAIGSTSVVLGGRHGAPDGGLLLHGHGEGVVGGGVVEGGRRARQERALEHRDSEQHTSHGAGIRGR